MTAPRPQVPAHSDLPLFQRRRDFDRLILRDGTTAAVRVAQPEDEEALRRFFNGLSPESRARRFFSQTGPPAELVASLCDPSDPRSKLTLLAIREQDGRPCILATGSYWAKDATTAEVAFAVSDTFQGKGLGTLLLERLALVAARHGFLKLWALTQPENLAMREVFKESGLDSREALDGSEMEVELSALPSPAGQARTDMRDRIATVASLRPFFKPKSVAVVGASRDPASIGHRMFQALLTGRFQGPVYPVNPKAEEIAGHRAYPSVRHLPEAADLAVIVVPRDRVLEVVDDCVARGVRALVVITAGFAEMGEEGRALQNWLVAKIRQSGMRMIGPNCFGLVNTDPAMPLNATFSSVQPPHGRVAMSSQSGALGLAVLAAAQRLHVGISTFVSIGNKADVSSNDLLQYWEEDPATDVILLYLESFGNPRRFARIARRVSRDKPIVAVKAGRTQAGGRAAGSHTAALAASDVAVEALFQQSGVIRAETLAEMFALAEALANQPLPAGRRVGIVTNAGGPAILCADACAAGGLQVPELSRMTQTGLAAFLPDAASVKNPVDLIASATPEPYRRAVETILRSGEVDALIVLYVSVGQADAAIADGILAGVTAAREHGGSSIPVLACWMAEQEKNVPQALQEAKIPVSPFPETPALVLSKVASYADWRSRPVGAIPEFPECDVRRARDLCRRALDARGPGWLTTDEMRSVLMAMHVPLPPGGLAGTAEEAAALARKIGFPVVVKLASHRIVHKTELGVVHLNLMNEGAVRQAFSDIQHRLAQDHSLEAMDGVLVQPMLTGGVEVMVGVTQDALFGPLIAFGLGGIHVEILGDVQFRITPLTDREAAEMVRAIKGYRLLEGYRGHAPADLKAIEDLLLRVAHLVEHVPEITELDLNPVFAFQPGHGVRIADARLRVGSA